MRTTPEPATRAYADSLLSTAALKGVGETCAAMTPSLCLYASVGGRLAAGDYGDYAKWIETYADPGFEELAARPEALLDRYVPDTPAVHESYRRVMRLEVGFFEAALQRNRTRRDQRGESR